MNEVESFAIERAAKNAFMLYNHIKLELAERDHTVFSLTIEENSKNPYGRVHGGALYSLGDVATGAAAHTDGRHYVTQSGTLHYLANVTEGVVTAAATVRHRGRSTCLSYVEITADNGKLLATGEFTLFCVDLPLTEKV